MRALQVSKLGKRPYSLHVVCQECKNSALLCAVGGAAGAPTAVDLTRPYWHHNVSSCEVDHVTVVNGGAARETTGP